MRERSPPPSPTSHLMPSSLLATLACLLFCGRRFATSVGSKALTIKQACMIALVMEFIGATFLGGNMPDELPDLSEHNNFLCDVLKKQPELYKSLKDKKTKLGVTLGHCIKTGIDNKGE